MRRSILTLLAWITVAPWLLGGTCGGGGSGSGGTPSGTPKATLTFDFPISQGVSVSDQIPVYVHVSTNGHMLQAYELNLQASIGTIAIYNAAANAQFDDDGGFFVAPRYEFLSGKIAGLVDMKHGPSWASGNMRLASFTMSAHHAGAALLAFEDVKLATPDGVEFQVTASTVNFNVGP